MDDTRVVSIFSRGLSWYESAPWRVGEAWRGIPDGRMRQHGQQVPLGVPGERVGRILQELYNK